MEEQKPRQKHISSMSSQPGQSQAIRFFPMKPTAMSETGHGGQQTTFVGTKVSTTCQTSFSSEANGREDNRVANNEAVHQRFQVCIFLRYFIITSSLDFIPVNGPAAKQHLLYVL
jgi:hypothetical protein